MPKEAPSIEAAIAALHVVHLPRIAVAWLLGRGFRGLESAGIHIQEHPASIPGGEWSVHIVVDVRGRSTGGTD